MVLWCNDLGAQGFALYNTGANSDGDFQGQGGVCLMGGASENDDAMAWFLQRAGGGDIVVLRASGSDGYNSYMYSQLGVDVHRVTTIVCQNANASSHRTCWSWSTARKAFGLPEGTKPTTTRCGKERL